MLTDSRTCIRFHNVARTLLQETVLGHKVISYSIKQCLYSTLYMYSDLAHVRAEFNRLILNRLQHKLQAVDRGKFKDTKTSTRTIVVVLRFIAHAHQISGA